MYEIATNAELNFFCNSKYCFDKSVGNLQVKAMQKLL